MKRTTISLITLLLFFFVIADSSSAQETTIRIQREGKTMPLADALTQENGRDVLIVEENEAVRLLVGEGVKLASSNPDSVAVLNDSILFGAAPNGEAEISASRGGDPLSIVGVDQFIVVVQATDNTRQIVSQSTFLTYKTVKDNFGKKFAKSYFVIQVDIRNEKLNEQFIVQTIDVLIDPNQCEKGRALYALFPVAECRRIFRDNFRFPSVQQGVRREEVIAVGKADLNRSNRNLGFRILAFTAGMGTILTGFNGVLGPDGVKGVNVLGTTVTSAANGLFPNNADEKLDNLRNSLPTEDVIIKSKESKTFNIFIPTERVFWSKPWNDYIKAADESSFATYKLKAVLDLVLLSSATGVLVKNDAPKVVVKSGDKVDEQVAKFQLRKEVRTDFLATAKDANATLADLRKALQEDETRDDAEDILRGILSTLKSDKDLKSFFAAEPGITIDSDGEVIRQAIIRIRGKVLLSGKDALVNKINEAIVKAAQ